MFLTEWRFCMTNLNKMTWEPCIFERADVFFTIWAWEQCVFQKIDVFVTIRALERLVFLYKSEKKREQFTFLTTYGHDNRVSFMKNLKKRKTWEHCFWKNVRFFWQNVGKRGAFFRKWTFFDKMWAWEQYFFREKSEKKGILLTFLPHNIVYFWQRWRFCD